MWESDGVLLMMEIRSVVCNGYNVGRLMKGDGVLKEVGWIEWV